MKLKKAFSFFELLIVLFLLVTLYGVFIINFNFDFEKKEEKLSFQNLKEHLLTNYIFDKSLKFSCLKYEKSCYVFIDNHITKENKIDFLLDDEIVVYAYDKELKKLSFPTLDFDNLESHEVLFDLSIDRDNKSNEMIVKLQDGIFVMNALEKPTKLASLNEVKDFFEKRETEVKDAF